MDIFILTVWSLVLTALLLYVENNNKLIIGLPVRAEETPMMNEDQVDNIIQRWVRQTFSTRAIKPQLRQTHTQRCCEVKCFKNNDEIDY